MYTQKISIL